MAPSIALRMRYALTCLNVLEMPSHRNRPQFEPDGHDSQCYVECLHCPFPALTLCVRVHGRARLSSPVEEMSTKKNFGFCDPGHNTPACREVMFSM